MEPQEAACRPPEEEAMTDEEYEDAYREALYCLAEGCPVCNPSLDFRGRRVCRVDGHLLTDEQVLERWWGPEIAEQIRQEYAELQVRR